MNYLSDDQVNDAVEFMMQTAPIIGKAKARMEGLAAQRKHLVGILMREAEEKAGSKLAIAAQERDAHADDRYLEHLRKEYSATEEYERLRWELEARQVLISAWQTINANARSFPRL